MQQEDSARVPVSFWRVALYFLRLGALGFGGPIALVGRMQQDLVDDRHWISKKEYLEGLALSQLAPGPLAAQLAMYLGYIRGGVAGASVVGALFILPSFLLVWAIAVAYVRYGGLGWMQAVFYGVAAAVIGIIARSAWKLARRVRLSGARVGGRRADGAFHDDHAYQEGRTPALVKLASHQQNRYRAYRCSSDARNLRAASEKSGVAC
jgi:chromate transport protein ChrA